MWIVYGLMDLAQPPSRTCPSDDGNVTPREVAHRSAGYLTADTFGAPKVSLSVSVWSNVAWVVEAERGRDGFASCSLLSLGTNKQVHITDTQRLVLQWEYQASRLLHSYHLH